MKKSLAMTVAAMVMAACTGTALAGNYSIGHPFYTPDKDERVLTAGVEYTSWKYDKLPGFKASSTEVGANLDYGASDKVVLFATVYRNWDRYKDANHGTKNARTNSWDVGALYKFIDNGKTYLSGYACYEQDHGNSVLMGERERSSEVIM